MKNPADRVHVNNVYEAQSLDLGGARVQGAKLDLLRVESKYQAVRGWRGMSYWDRQFSLAIVLFIMLFLFVRRLVQINSQTFDLGS